MIVSNGSTNNLLQCWLAILQIFGDGRFEEEIHSVLVLVLGEDGLEHVGNVVCLDDTTCAPDLENLGKVDVPVMFLVGLIDDVDALNIGRQTGSVGGYT